MQKSLKKFIVPLLVVITSALIYLFGMVLAHHNTHQFKNLSTDTIALLLPDDNVDPTLLRGWEDIAAEEGLHLMPITNYEFNKEWYFTSEKLPFAGMIIPDTIYKAVTPALVKQLTSYVNNGGKLMVVYDAGTLNLNDTYYPHKGPLSNLVGVDYALYDTLGPNTTQRSKIGGTKNMLNSLEIPPGKAIPFPENAISPNGNEFWAISGYQYGALDYPHFTTENPQANNQTLLLAPDNELIANIHPFGKGQVLFVNIPLTYLWYRTDSMLFHAFLHYFAMNLLHVPILSATPQGIGGIIMNLHVESNASRDSLLILKQAGIFNQGPYSIDVTAGPDSTVPGDTLGFDLPNSPVSQQLLKYFASTGQTIGSDGGWMHNYFCFHANASNQSEFQKYLTWNIQAIEKVTNQKILEYMPPCDVQPLWSIEYLTSQGIIGYYTTSNTGAPPTHAIHQGIFDAPNVWSFPTLLYGKDASFEEFNEHHLTLSEIQNWLLAATQFVADQHTIRLIYYHPPGPMNFNNQIPGGISYMPAMTAWVDLGKQLAAQHVFRWYSMANIAQFLNTRKLVSWSVHIVNGQQLIKASHPTSLKDQAWFINKTSCQKPLILQGQGYINQDPYLWIVVAGDVKDFRFSCKLV